MALYKLDTRTILMSSTSPQKELVQHVFTNRWREVIVDFQVRRNHRTIRTYSSDMLDEAIAHYESI